MTAEDRIAAELEATRARAARAAERIADVQTRLGNVKQETLSEYRPLDAKLAERLGYMDIVRHESTGRLAEVFGGWFDRGNDSFLEVCSLNGVESIGKRQLGQWGLLRSPR